MIWREKKWLLISLGVLLAINAIFFVTYRVRYEQRVQDLEQRLAEQSTEYETVRLQRERVEQRLLAYRSVDQGIERVYRQWWSTPRERLAPLIIELRDLARKSGLEPEVRSYAYTESSRNQGPVAAREMTITFAVSGSYDQVRRLINLIELSAQFMIIDQIGLTETGPSGGSFLNLNLKLKTLFHEVEQEDLRAVDLG